MPPDVQKRFWSDYEALREAILANAQADIMELPPVTNENVDAANFLSFVNVLVQQADYWISIEKYAQALIALEQLEPWLHSDEWPLL